MPEKKSTSVDDDTCNGCAVAADPLRRAVNYSITSDIIAATPSVELLTDDICTMVDGADEITTHAERVVYDERNAVLMCDLR